MDYETDYELHSGPQKRVIHTSVSLRTLERGFCVILDPFDHLPRITLMTKTLLAQNLTARIQKHLEFLLEHILGKQATWVMILRACSVWYEVW
jgi:hypothetical protein